MPMLKRKNNLKKNNPKKKNNLKKKLLKKKLNLKKMILSKSLKRKRIPLIYYPLLLSISLTGKLKLLIPINMKLVNSYLITLITMDSLYGGLDMIKLKVNVKKCL